MSTTQIEIAKGQRYDALAKRPDLSCGFGTALGRSAGLSPLRSRLWGTESIPAHGQNTCVVDVSKPGHRFAAISRGQQIEEFNHQFEGGLYAQLINNPSFEELKNPIAEWYRVKRGASQGDLIAQTAADTGMLNSNQKHCIKLRVTSVVSGGVGLANEGYWGIGLKNHTTYKVSFWAKKGGNFSGTLKAKLENNGGVVYAESPDFKPAAGWKHFTCNLTTRGVPKPAAGNRFVIYASRPGDVYFDVVTVMPPTWKNRPNGLRPDLAEKLAGLKLQYIQFPGGCTAESCRRGGELELEELGRPHRAETGFDKKQVGV